MRSPVLVALKSERRRLAKALKLHDSMLAKLSKTAGKKTGKRKTARKPMDTGEVESIKIKDRPAKTKPAKLTAAQERAAKREALLGRKSKGNPGGEGGE